MKRYIIIAMLMLCGITFAQQSYSVSETSDNIFSDSETLSADNDSEQSQALNNPGGPGDPVPIDDYIPVLAIAGAALAIYAARKKQLQTGR